jgi:hypothetical protein
MSFNPSPSKSATCNSLIWLSMGKISGPVNPKVLVLVCARLARHAATAIVVAQKNRLNGIIIETQRKVPSLDWVGEPIVRMREARRKWIAGEVEPHAAARGYSPIK